MWSYAGMPLGAGLGEGLGLGLGLGEGLGLGVEPVAGGMMLPAQPVWTAAIIGVHGDDMSPAE